MSNIQLNNEDYTLGSLKKRNMYLIKNCTRTKNKKQENKKKICFNVTLGEHGVVLYCCFLELFKKVTVISAYVCFW